MDGLAQHVARELAAYRPSGAAESADVERVRALLAESPDPWRRELPLHVTGSAVIVHPPTRRVLLRWHERQQAWLHVGGHGDPGETHPLQVATREAIEETGLTDLSAWPDASLVHLAVVPVPASTREPAHEHADLRYVLATREPDDARSENEVARLRWLVLDEAVRLTTSPSLRETLRRMLPLLG